MIYVVLTLIIFFIISNRYKFINKSIIFTPLSTSYFSFSISITTIIYLYISGYIPLNEFTLLLIQWLIFLMFILITPFLLKNLSYNFSENIILNRIDFQAANIIFFFGFILLFFYDLLLLSNYLSGDERLLLNKNYRAFSILKDMFVEWAVVILSLCYLKSKRKKYLYKLLMLLLLVTYSGSKGALLEALLIFIFFYLQFYSVGKKTKIKFFLLFLLFISLPSLIMYGNKFYEIILNRIIMTSDIYFLSYVIGDYKDLIGYYNPFMYFLHPFTSLIGVRGYDFPLGANILSTANLPVTGTGPNSHITILNMIFFNDCYTCIIISSIFFGLISLACVYFSFKFLKTKIDNYYKFFLFCTLYKNQLTLFFDVGIFEFKIIILFIGLFLYVTLNFLKKKHYRKLCKTTGTIQCE